MLTRHDYLALCTKRGILNQLFTLHSIKIGINKPDFYLPLCFFLHFDYLLYHISHIITLEIVGTLAFQSLQLTNQIVLFLTSLILFG